MTSGSNGAKIPRSGYPESWANSRSEKNLDAIAANDVSKSDRGFEADRNALAIYFADGRALRIALAAKTKCAATLVRALEEICAAKKK